MWNQSMMMIRVMQIILMQVIVGGNLGDADAENAADEERDPSLEQTPETPFVSNDSAGAAASTIIKGQSATPAKQAGVQQPKNQPTPRRTELRHGAFLVDAELHWELHWELYWDPGRTQGSGQRAQRQRARARARGASLGHRHRHRHRGSLGRPSAIAHGPWALRGLPKEGEGKKQEARGQSQSTEQPVEGKSRGQSQSTFAVIALWLAWKLVPNFIATCCFSVCFTVSSAGRCSCNAACSTTRLSVALMRSGLSFVLRNMPSTISLASLCCCRTPALLSLRPTCSTEYWCLRFLEFAE